MHGITTFTHSALPGLTGFTLPGVPFTAFVSKSDAEIRTASAYATIETAIVERTDGRFLIAIIDRDDDSFVWAS